MPDNNDPYRAYNFKLIIQDVTEGHFTEVLGLGINVGVVAYREAGNAQIVRRIPSQVDYDPVELRYGLTESRALWDWLMTVVDGRVERKNVSIAMLSSDGATEVMRWNLLNAWPSRWKGAPLDAMTHEVAIESLTLVYESLSRE
jgi:phage tail-like protein